VGTALAKFRFPLKTNEVTRGYFQAMAKIEAGPVKSDLANVTVGSQEAMERVAHASAAWNATPRTTSVATQIEGRHAKNALPQLAAADVNCRVLPEDSVKYVTEVLKKIWADDQVNLAISGEVSQGPPSPMRDDLFKAVSRLTDSMWPGVPAVPIMVTGATGGRYLRAIGIPTYAVQGCFFDRDDIRFQGRDERMSVRSFHEGQTFLYELVKPLSQ
jgi:acetylornithine deacetylase/succinyl-diaminopimelate desuccinylase-like protein